MAKKTLKFDPAAVLDTDAALAEYMAAALETGDASFIADCVGVVARARGMSEIARDSGLSREHLYRSFSTGGNPTLQSFFAVLKALNVNLTATITGAAVEDAIKPKRKAAARKAKTSARNRAPAKETAAKPRVKKGASTAKVA